MKLKNTQYQLDIRVELCEHGVLATVPVEVTDGALVEFGLTTPRHIEIRKFVVTDKNEFLKLISDTIDLMYENKE